jgi:hypothetical protein
MMMEQRNGLSTRRSALGRMLAVAFGAAGIGALAESKTSEASRSKHGSTLTLYGVQIRQMQVGPTGAAKTLPFGALADAKGRELGSFHTALVDSTNGALTMQTFDLQDGTIVGIGSNDSYVVLGGTGTYAGVTGSYEERSAARLPGRQFTFTFREGTDGSS